ncbi:hypothetical protein B0H13DRAFT_2058221 [Mycena leptocephala]|nr:hypothetical protein B0H13DRAFT_2058221 [Mycena leptocephala]
MINQKHSPPSKQLLPKTSHPYLLLAPASPPSAHAAKRHRSRRTRRARCTRRGRRVGRLGARMLLVLALLQQGVWKKRVGLARRHERMRNRMRSRLARRCEEGRHRQVARVAFGFVRDLLSNSWCPRRPIVPANEELAAASTNPTFASASAPTTPTPNPPSPPQNPRSATRRRRRTDRLPKVRTIGLPIGLPSNSPQVPLHHWRRRGAEAAYPIPNAAYTPQDDEEADGGDPSPSPFFVLLLLFPAAPSTRAPSPRGAFSGVEVKRGGVSEW